MKNKITISTLSLLFLLMLTGCSRLSLNTSVINANYEAVDQLLLNSNFSKKNFFIVTTIVDINQIESSSPLGRTISEQLTTRFVQNGVKLVELKMRDNIYMKNETGELMLSRKVGELADEIKADAVVVGTYSDSHEVVYVSLRIVNPKTNVIVSTLDYELEKDSNIKALLGQSLGRSIF